MSKIDYRADRVRAIGSTAFTEASKEELRALIALMELHGEAENVEKLAEAANISVPRCKSALAFWEESGVIRPSDAPPMIIDEFEDRLVRGEIDEVSATRVASSIRDEQLASMIDECAMLMNQACLSNPDVKNITALYTQYSLSPEYIVTLAAYLASAFGRRLSANQSADVYGIRWPAGSWLRKRVYEEYLCGRLGYGGCYHR